MTFVIFYDSENTYIYIYSELFVKIVENIYTFWLHYKSSKTGNIEKYL